MIQMSVRLQRDIVTTQIIQEELEARNQLNLNQPLGKRAAQRATKCVRRHLFEDHREDVKYIQSIAAKVKNLGHVCEFITAILPESQEAYKLLLISPKVAMKCESAWRSHVYIETCHMHANCGGILASSSTLDAENELFILAIMHCKTENETEYIRFMRFFKTFPPNYQMRKYWQSTEIEIRE